MMGQRFMRNEVAQAACLWGGRASRLPNIAFDKNQTLGKMPGVPTDGTPVPR